MDETVTVAYHPLHKSVIEIYDVGGVLIADLPSDQTVTGRQASEVLNACLETDEVLVRELER